MFNARRNDCQYDFGTFDTLEAAAYAALKYDTWINYYNVVENTETGEVFRPNPWKHLSLETRTKLGKEIGVCYC